MVKGKSSRRENPIVFMDITVAKEVIGRLLIELRADIVPKAAENFRALCTGDCKDSRGRPLHYLGTHDSHLQAGDIDGNGGLCVYGTKHFEDENFLLRHVGPGTVSMVNSGPDSNGSQFNVFFASAPWLDIRNVVVGALIGEKSFETLGILHEMTASENGQPKKVVMISNCGQVFP
ncbi:peptidyl-prolyl cis-trans isomerase H [Thraustotheca clavata]|uniref:Peptidyl-prolyl cis-trans isomerase n=1 Tax=Thraustotheca clavata TaxID=74557 RepID=A0A1W0A7B0_9STRA|nr:peptidyl-prolyl cis-trans isomerase H [Thraustotheca clavata]